jgi:nondiscriminating glutamyl-tRNA synthetase
MVTTRFAPSPTGYLHIGGLRTALYCYLLARRHGGKFLLRIEDTDRTRLVPDAIPNMLRMFEIFGIVPDEGPHKDGGRGPYLQSERLPIYQERLHDLVKQGHAYYCFCSSERLDALRQEQEELKLPPRYDGHCRNLPYEESRARVDAGESYTIRLKVPKAEKVEMIDLIRGRIEFNTSDVEDQILLKTDGFPTYHGAIVIDDALMGITHVMRGEEWISSIPKQILTARALGIELPKYAHMPNIMGTDGKKLSKRTGDTAAEIYIEKGYLPEAILNFVAFLGWNPKTTQEIFTLDELVEVFDLGGMGKSGAVLDPVKLDWMNSQHLMRLPDEEVLSRLGAYLQEYRPEFYVQHFSKASSETNLNIVRELKTRLKRFDEFPDLTKFLYGDAAVRPDLLCNAKMKIETLEQAKTALQFALSVLEKYSEISDFEAFKADFLASIAALGYKNGQILWPLRIALSGEEFSPGAFELAYLL